MDEVAARSPSARLATLRCPQCGEGRTVNDRHAQRVRAGQFDGVCGHCRAAARITIGEEERGWAQKTLSRMTDSDRALVSYALACLENCRRVRSTTR